MANHGIEEVEGVGPAIGEKLRAAGIGTTDALLEGAKTTAQRQALAESTGLSEKVILKFANAADLFHIAGVGSEFAELLGAAGVDTVSELARRNPENLTRRMAALNQERDITRHIPSEKEVTRWVALARTLPRMLEY